MRWNEEKAGNRAQLADCLPRLHNALGFIPMAAESRCDGPPCNASTLEVEAEGSEGKGHFLLQNKLKG